MRKTNAALGQGTNVCVYFRGVESFLPSLTLSLLCENRFFAFKTDVLHSQITGREGKNSNNSLGETLAGSAKVGTYHAC